MSSVEIGRILSEKHGFTLSHRESVPIKEVFQGTTVWDGVVHVFNLFGHPQTDRLYAWWHDTGDPKNPKLITVLHIHPATTPLSAVQAFIAQEYHNAKAAQEAETGTA
jgi:hypothetical protein